MDCAADSIASEVGRPEDGVRMGVRAAGEGSVQTSAEGWPAAPYSSYEKVQEAVPEAGAPLSLL